MTLELRRPMIWPVAQETPKTEARNNRVNDMVVQRQVEIAVRTMQIELRYQKNKVVSEENASWWLSNYGFGDEFGDPKRLFGAIMADKNGDKIDPKEANWALREIEKRKR